MTIAKKSGIAKIGQILEFLCFLSCLTIILTKQSVSIFIMEYRFDNIFIFSHKSTPLVLTEVVTMGAAFHYRSFLIYAWDVLLWLS